MKTVYFVCFFAICLALTSCQNNETEISVGTCLTVLQVEQGPASPLEGCLESDSDFEVCYL